MKPDRGCLDFLAVPISPTGPVFWFLAGHYAVFRIYSRLIHGRGWTETLVARVSLVTSGFFLACFISMIIWRLVCRMLSAGFGEVEEPALSRKAGRITIAFGVFAMATLLLTGLLMEFEPTL